MAPTPATPEDRHWLEEYEKHRFSQLDDLRATAEKWAGSISALTGVFSMIVLIKGPEDIADLSDVGRVLVIAFLGVALVAAATAIYRAAIAAQGTPVEVTPATYKAAYYQAVHTAASGLRTSRLLAIVAVVALALGIGLTWLWPIEAAPTPNYAVVVDSAGLAHCGELVDQKGQLTLKTIPAGQPLLLDQVVDLISVSGCPE